VQKEQDTTHTLSCLHQIGGDCYYSHKNKDLIKPNKTKQARQSKQAIGGDLGFGLVWVSERLIGKEPMHNLGEFHQHNGLRVIKN